MRAMRDGATICYRRISRDDSVCNEIGMDGSRVNSALDLANTPSLSVRYGKTHHYHPLVTKSAHAAQRHECWN